jgi:hypothetical protein
MKGVSGDHVGHWFSLLTVRSTGDAMNRLTNMVDGIGTTVYTYDKVGQLVTQVGPSGSNAMSNIHDSIRQKLQFIQPMARERPMRAFLGHQFPGRILVILRLVHRQKLEFGPAFDFRCGAWN